MSVSERLEIARSLHDGIAQELLGLTYRLQNILGHEDITPALKAEMRQMQSRIDAAVASIRNEIFALREGIELSLAERIESFIATIEGGPEIIFSANLDYNYPELDEVLSNVAQELIRNAVVHAGASRIDIALTNSDNYLHLSISDDGNGGIHDRDGHFGLALCHEQIETLGGAIDIDTSSGTSIWIRIPLASSL